MRVTYKVRGRNYVEMLQNARIRANTFRGQGAAWIGSDNITVRRTRLGTWVGTVTVIF